MSLPEDSELCQEINLPRSQKDHFQGTRPRRYQNHIMFYDVCVRFNSGSTAVLEIWRGELLRSSPGLVTEAPPSVGASEAFSQLLSVGGDGGGCPAGSVCVAGGQAAHI